jgi:hypothetical protein
MLARDVRLAAFAFGLLASVAPLPSNAQQPSVRATFDDFAFLAGSCWKGTFPGRTVTDEHCFEWVFGPKKFLRDRHVVRGDSVPYSGETIYAWDAGRKELVFWYISSAGFYSTGSAGKESDAILFADTIKAEGGDRTLRTTWRQAGADAYDIRVEERTASATKELWSMHMQRSGKAAASSP